MKRRSKTFFYLFLILFLIPFTSSYIPQGHMKLLAVSESSKGFEGSIADLFLEIKPGNGRVFIDTYPYSKLDTQVSTRFAKEIACNHFDIDCASLDFIYTIKADSAIVGGPSAGSAIALLTAAMLKEKDVDNNIAITGTINSGGLIGPVSGFREKINAAAANNIKKVLIPKGTRFIKDNNETFDLKKHASNLSVDLIEVAGLDQAMSELTGEEIKTYKENLEVDPTYIETMRQLAQQLCDKSKQYETELLKYDLKGITKKELIEVGDKAVDLQKKAAVAYNSTSYYSAASYCFGANLQYKILLLNLMNLSMEETLSLMEKLEQDMHQFNEETNIDITTITDLQTYMVVKERLTDAFENLNKTKESLFDNRSYIGDLAYSTERLYSAKSWSQFFGKKSTKFNLDQESLKETCLKKISEAEERINYILLFLPFAIKDAKNDLDYAKTNFDDRNYELCIFKATKAKAEVNTIISVIGLAEEHLNEVITNKIDASRRSILKQTTKGIFPILGYSYYVYARDLAKGDKYSALLYSEYAIELSNLDIYFKSDEEKPTHLQIIKTYKLELRILIAGFILGFFAAIFIRKIVNRHRRKKRKHKS